MALFLGGIAVAHFTAGRLPRSRSLRDGSAAAAPGFSGRAADALCEPGAGRAHRRGAGLAGNGATRAAPAIDRWIRASVPYQTPELMERYLEGMRKAGLNEH